MAKVKDVIVVAQNNPQTTKIIVGLFLIAGVGYYFYKRGTAARALFPIPKDQGGEIDQQKLNELAGDLYEDMKGVDLFGAHDIDIYERVAVLSNSEFVALHNTFNSKYQSDSGQTLTEWVRSEFSVPYSQFETIKNTFVKRSNNLNLY